LSVGEPDGDLAERIEEVIEEGLKEGLGKELEYTEDGVGEPWS
jgi:hypothetical protein